MSVPQLSNTHALLIAVNKYKTNVHQDLGGCIYDAESVSSYLTSTLDVPPDNLLRLYDERATRQGIIDAFWDHLILNNKIRHSDPIVVYFSGHGSQQPAPTEWYSSNGQTELILPHDAGWHPTPGSTDWVYTHGIPDRTLRRLIHQLRHTKGDNITIILDCCHSGSATRANIRIRTSQDSNAPLIPPDLDQDIFQTFSSKYSGRLKQLSTMRVGHDRLQGLNQAPSLETHVLLAACKNDEVAQEIETPTTAANSSPEPGVSGLFTWALLEALRECDMATSSYSRLMRTVQNRTTKLLLQQAKKYPGIRIQTPQCEGQKQDRLLFRTQYALSKGMIRLDSGPEKNAFRIAAGSASGIREYTELDVYHGSMLDKPPPIAQLVATQVDGTTSILEFRKGGPVVPIPEDSYVVVTKYTGYSIRILYDDRLEHDELWQDVFSKVEAQQIDVIWCDPGEQSDLVLVPTDKGVEVQRTDPSLIQLSPRPIVLENGLSANELAQRLTAIAHFHFHLQRQNPRSPIKSQVGMKLIELKCERSYSWGGKEYSPRSPNPKDLFGDSLSTGTVVDLQATSEHRYGLELSNRSNWPLFAWVFYFDLEDYSINVLYSPPSRTMNPPLSNDGKVLAVGYGDSGVEPLRVDNCGYSRRETGVFMLFVSHHWVDISHMEQSSIFEPVSEGESRDGKGKLVTPASEAWSVMTVRVSIQQ